MSSSIYASLTRENEKLGLQTYTQAQNNKVLKLVADVLSFSSDEAIWFGAPGIIGVILFLIRKALGNSTMGCFEEAVWDCFGSAMVGTSTESILKLIFRTTRPYYAKQSTFHSLLGECYSFPSGHTLRAFYWMFWLTRGRFVRLIVHFPRARYFIPWAIGVGWSRVAKGKHWPIDVFVGAIVGSLLGYFVEDYCSPSTRAVIKTIGGLYTAIGWGFIALIPMFGGKSLLGRVLVGVAYFALGLSILFTTLPLTHEVAGGQTIANIIIGEREATECRANWLW